MMTVDQKHDEKVVREWLGGYVAVGEALLRLHDGKKGVEFAEYVTERFGLTYHRAIQIELASTMANKVVAAGGKMPHNEAISYRLHRVAKMHADNLGEIEGAEEKGVAVAVELWKSVLTTTQKPTVNILNKAISEKFPKAPKPEVKAATAQDFIGSAVSMLTEAHNAVVASPSSVDLSAVEELVVKIKLLTTPKTAVAVAA